jgi:hypothetical protein
MHNNKAHFLCLVCICCWFGTNGDTWHGKSRTLRFKCLVFKVIGQCNDIYGYCDFGEGILSVSSNGLGRQNQKAVITQIKQRITATVGNSNPVPHKIKN